MRHIDKNLMDFNYTKVFVTLAALDFDRLVQFYRQLLAREPAFYLASVYAEFQLEGLTLGIFSPQSKHQSEFASSAGSGLSLCLEVTDLETAIAFLTEMGYPPSGEIFITSHGQEIYAFDPGGNRLILHQSII
jgi:predicted enzyme related to lactoylglutathione lyase